VTFRITAVADPDVSASGRRLGWLAAGSDGTPVGAASLRLFSGSGQVHLSELELNVDPAQRRKGIGSALLDAAVTAARADGRRSIIAQAQAGSPGAKFAAARAFKPVLALVYSRLSLADADIIALTAIVEQPYPGYRLVSWDGMVPDGLAETFASSRRAMDDMPMGSTDFGTVTWDVERVRAAAAAVEQRGELLHTVAALTESDGTIAGFSELVVPGDGTGDGQHYGTGVLPEHRGHGLGRWMKASAILHAGERHPQLRGLLTDTADTNAPMRRINHALGYVPTHTTYEYQLDL
jgi:GNAT superfamily N-acetyltransferase